MNPKLRPTFRTIITCRAILMLRHIGALKLKACWAGSSNGVFHPSVYQAADGGGKWLDETAPDSPIGSAQLILRKTGVNTITDYKWNRIQGPREQVQLII